MIPILKSGNVHPNQSPAQTVQSGVRWTQENRALLAICLHVRSTPDSLAAMCNNFLRCSLYKALNITSGVLTEGVVVLTLHCFLY